MKTRLLALALVTAVTPLAMATPAAAQSRADQYQWEQAQRRFANEQAIFDQARARYEASRRRGYGGYGGSGRYGWKEGPDWEPSRYYRDDPRYEERPLSSQDEVYRGNDGRYYCRRSDGTTGLVVGAGVGALTGRAIDGGRNRATGTIVGGVLGALIGREVERSSDMRCR
ncbi:glycine zipper 2TM domain-containing protein [Allosphingosinicella sp.]|uniref:glycine zipper 2TM domain-containing protein n=1 Tax=Allosphingosinicella sp. TaxID=2823234 RepID=UPI003784858F